MNATSEVVKGGVVRWVMRCLRKRLRCDDCDADAARLLGYKKELLGC